MKGIPPASTGGMKTPGVFEVMICQTVRSTTLGKVVAVTTNGGLPRLLSTWQPPQTDLNSWKSCEVNSMFCCTPPSPPAAAMSDERGGIGCDDCAGSQVAGGVTTLIVMLLPASGTGNSLLVTSNGPPGREHPSAPKIDRIDRIDTIDRPNSPHPAAIHAPPADRRGKVVAGVIAASR